MSSATLTTPTLTAECLEASVTLTRSGHMPAHLILSSDVAPVVGEAATITLAGDDPGTAQTFTGTIRRRGFWQGRARVVVVLGAGGLKTALPARDHIGGPTTVTALLVAQGIADAAGETLAASAAANLAGLGLLRWTRAGADALGHGGTGTEALDVLVARIASASARPAITWRLLADGTIWIGEDLYPTSAADIGETWIDDGDDGRIDCAPPRANLVPGTIINGRRAERVTYRVTGSTSRAEVLYQVAGDVVAREVPPVYTQTHGAVVKTQNTDGSLDLMADDPRLRGLRSVPFRIGIPGCKVTIPTGSRVRVAFADGDPSQLFAYALDQDTAAAVALALVGDSVSCGYLSGATAPTGGPVTFLLTPEAPVTIPPTPSIQITGIITGPGHAFVKGVSA
jgi:hypothetical protein